MSEVETELKWRKVVVYKRCLCPACYIEGKESKMKRPYGGHYKCPVCGLLLRAVEIYYEPLCDI